MLMPRKSVPALAPVAWAGGAVLVVALLAGCAAPAGTRTETRLPLARAWVDGRSVEYVTTDVSDAAMAAAMGVNHVPRLAAALPPRRDGGAPQPSAVERVYMFPGGEQVNIFQSAPRPAGPANADRAYSPLWRVVLVRWQRALARRELVSEEVVLAAEERGDLALEITDTVANCPIVRSADGAALRGVR